VQPLNNLLASKAGSGFYAAMTKAPTRQPARAARESSGHGFELFDDLMPIRRYKLLLQTFLKRRGTGSRQAIAEALGNTRSFVTQITSPAYDLAIPAGQVMRIVELAGLTADERRVFLDAYLEAHPERAAKVLGAAPGGRSLSIPLPTLRSEAAQRRLEQVIERTAAEIAAAFRALENGVADSDAGRDDAA
jgi:hypothetical protein